MLVARNSYDGYANHLLEFSELALGTTYVNLNMLHFLKFIHNRQ